MRARSLGAELLVGVCAFGCAREGDGRVPPELHGSSASDVNETPPGVAPAGSLDRSGSFAIAAGSYPLDGLSRAMPAGTLSCPDADVHEFAGEEIRFTPPARAVPAFRARLAVFEQVVLHVSRRVYGRAPSQILVAASYDCRAVSGRSGRISEHAFANAIDVTGFVFAPAPIVSKDGSIHPVAIPGSFDVRVDRHWRARGDDVAIRHARFLDELTVELLQREVFRTLLGPAHPDHEDHFHFDMAPSKYVQL